MVRRCAILGLGPFKFSCQEHELQVRALSAWLSFQVVRLLFVWQEWFRSPSWSAFMLLRSRYALIIDYLPATSPLSFDCFPDWALTFSSPRFDDMKVRNWPRCVLRLHMLGWSEPFGKRAFLHSYTVHSQRVKAKKEISEFQMTTMAWTLDHESSESSVDLRYQHLSWNPLCPLRACRHNPTQYLINRKSRPWLCMRWV